MKNSATSHVIILATTVALALSFSVVITGCGEGQSDDSANGFNVGPPGDDPNGDSGGDSNGDPSHQNNQQGNDPATNDGNGNDNDDDISVNYGQLTTCQVDTDCAADEACTQGGHCVNVTGERDATAAIQADLLQLDEAVGMGTPYRLPDNALLQLNDLTGDGIALTITDQIIFEGSGSKLEIENGVTAISLIDNSSWSMVRDMTIMPQDGAVHRPHEGIGIDVRAHGVRLDNIYMQYMGTGVRAFTTVDGEFANVNSQIWSRLVFRHMHYNATHLSGGDANGGVMTGLEVVGGAGINDNSFLGNTYVGPTMEGTHTHSIKLGSNAASNLVLGAYVELGDEHPSSNSLNDLFVGGNAINRLQGPGDRIGNLSARLRFRDTSDDGNMRVMIPGHEDSPIGWRHSDESHDWYLRYFDHPSYMSWGISYGNTGTVPFFWTGGEHPDGPALFDMGDVLQ